MCRPYTFYLTIKQKNTFEITTQLHSLPLWHRKARMKELFFTTTFKKILRTSIFLRLYNIIRAAILAQWQLNKCVWFDFKWTPFSPAAQWRHFCQLCWHKMQLPGLGLVCRGCVLCPYCLHMSYKNGFGCWKKYNASSLKLKILYYVKCM